MEGRLPSDFCGVILAGGKSSRFGSDKSRVRIGGRSSIERIAAAAFGFGPLLVVGGEPGLVSSEHRWVPDLYPGQGPLQGILSAHRAAPECTLLVLASDIPLVTPIHLEFLSRALPEGVDARIPRVNGQGQFLSALYGSSALRRLESCWAKEERSMRAFVRRLEVDWVDEDRLSVEALDPQGFRDFDTPADLEELQVLSFE